LNKKRVKYILFAVVFGILFFAASPRAVPGNLPSGLAAPLFQPADTLEPELKYKISDETGNPILDEERKKGLDLKDPENLEYTFDYDYKTGNITVYRKIGNMNIRLYSGLIPI